MVYQLVSGLPDFFYDCNSIQLSKKSSVLLKKLKDSNPLEEKKNEA